MPVQHPDMYADPGALRRDVVSGGLADVLGGIVRGIQAGQQIAAKEQLMEQQAAQEQRRELDFQRGLAAQDAAVAGSLTGRQSPLEPTMADLLGSAATARRSRTSGGGAATGGGSGVQPIPGSDIAAEFQGQAEDRAAAGSQAHAAKRALAHAEDDLLAEQATREAFQELQRSSGETEGRLSAIRGDILSRTGGGELPRDAVVAGEEGPSRVASPSASPGVTDPGRLDQAFSAIGGMRGRSPDISSGDDPLRDAYVGLEGALREEREASALLADLPGGLKNPAVEIGADPGTILDPTALATAVLRYRRTGDASVFEAFGGQVPEDLDGIVSRAFEFEREVNKRQIEDFLSRNKAAQKEAEEAVAADIDFADSIRSYGVDDPAEVARINEAVNETMRRTPSANPSKIIETLIGGHKATQKHGFAMEEEGGRRETKKTPTHSYTHSPARSESNRIKRLDLERKVLKDVDAATFRAMKALIDGAFIGGAEDRRRASNALRSMGLKGPAADARDELLREINGEGGGGGPPSFATEAEMDAAKARGDIGVGDSVVVGGVHGKVK